MRWWAAFALIVLVAMPHPWLWSLAHLLLFLSLMLILQNNVKKVLLACLKSWRILRWILLPTIIFHSFFTPGEVIWVSMPVSYEGLALGLHLCLYLGEMFIAALLLAYLLPVSIWLEFMMCNAFLKRYLFPYLLPYLRLMPVMMQGVQVLVRRTYRAWCMEASRVHSFPQYIKALLVDVSAYSDTQARRVWASWNTLEFTNLEKETLFDKKCEIRMLCLLLTYTAAEFFMRYL